MLYETNNEKITVADICYRFNLVTQIRKDHSMPISYSWNRILESKLIDKLKDEDTFILISKKYCLLLNDKYRIVGNTFQDTLKILIAYENKIEESNYKKLLENMNK